MAIVLTLSRKAHAVGIKRTEVGLAGIRQFDDLCWASASVPRPPSAQCVHMKARRPMLSAAFMTSCDFGVGVGDEAIDGDDGRDAELVHVLDMTLQVIAALGDGGDVLVLEVILGHAAVHLEGAHGSDDHGRRRREARLAALDVEELLGAEIGAEAGFGDDIVGNLERALGARARSCSRGRCWRRGRHG